MATESALCFNLEQRFGLRNARSDWVRRQTAFSIDELQSTICRTDLGIISSGTLPWNVSDAHAVRLGTRVLVQIDDITNIANPDPRSNERPRVLLLTLNDGCRDFTGVELECWQRISLSTTLGTKIILQNSARIMRGCVLLRERDFIVLGSPPSNIWGASHEELVSQARRNAGLPDPQGSGSSLARVLEAEHVQTIAQMLGNSSAEDLAVNVLPLGMGGIADPALVIDDESIRESDMDAVDAEPPSHRDVDGTRPFVIPDIPDCDSD